VADNTLRGCAFAAALTMGGAMSIDDPIPEAERANLEVTLPTALELCRLGLATMIDIRQSFEIEMKGAIPDTVHIPMFEVKLMLGHTLTEDEQDILDAGKPKDIDAKTFFTMINQLHHARDHLLLCVCNSGRRSLTAASLLRSLGYPKALSVAGGFQAWKKMNAVPPTSVPPPTAS
jgi:rhodanese-related sulfurtransferase